MTTMIRTYTELKRLTTFEERFRYLSLSGRVGDRTFGPDRYLNQMFYTSREWRQLRYRIIARDNGCDLGFPGFDIYKGLYIHHMNPMAVRDIVEGNLDILEPEFLICVSQTTHNAIHYGDRQFTPRVLVERRPGDTKLWGNKGGEK